jgi:hypothetical protein
VRPLLAPSRDAEANRSSLPLPNWKSLVGFELVTVTTVLAIYLVFASRDLLPLKYFRDDLTIQADIVSTPIGFRNSSFGRTAAAFRSLHLANHATLVAAIGILMTLILVWRCRPEKESGLWPFVCLAAAIGTAGVYLTEYTKEFFVLPWVIAFTYIGTSRARQWIWLLGLAAYGEYMRADWLLVAAFCPVLLYSLHRCRSVIQLCLFLVLFVFALAVAFQVLLGHSLHYYRYLVSQGESVDITTIIRDPFGESGLANSIANGIVGLAYFLFPVPLLLLGKSIYTLSAAFTGTYWSRIFRSFRAISEAPDSQAYRNMALIMSVTIAQSLYAPDWGSYARHITPVLPLLATAVATGRSSRLRNPVAQIRVRTSVGELARPAR